MERQEVSQQTADVRRCHRGTRDGVGRVFAALPGGQDVQTRSKDVGAFAKVGEVGTFIGESRGSDGHALFGASGRVVARVGIIIARSHGKVETSVHSSVHGQVESDGFTSSKTHVSHAALELLVFAGLGGSDLVGVGAGGPLNTFDNIRHGARPAGSQNLDSVDVGFFGHTEFLASDGAGAVSAVAVAILIDVILRNCLAPVSTSLEVNMVNIGAGVDDIGVDAFATLVGVEVFVEGAEAERLAVRDTGQSPWSVLLNVGIGLMVDLGVTFDEINLDD